ncbi:MAG: hypothetical protein ACOYJK_02995 [Prevotella sp.]|jgi:hypothetical protein
MKNKFLYLTMLISFVAAFTFSACESDDPAEPLPTKMFVESPKYDILVGTIAADTTVINLRWIELNSTYRLVMSNTMNELTVDIPDKSVQESEKVRAMQITDSDILNCADAMSIPKTGMRTMNLMLYGTLSNGASDSTSTSINVRFIEP